MFDGKHISECLYHTTDEHECQYTDKFLCLNKDKEVVFPVEIDISHEEARKDFQQIPEDSLSATQ